MRVAVLAKRYVYFLLNRRRPLVTRGGGSLVPHCRLQERSACDTFNPSMLNSFFLNLRIPIAGIVFSH